LSNLDLSATDLEEMAAHLRQLNKSSLEVEMIKSAGCRLRLKSTKVAGPRDEEVRVYKIISISPEDERPPGGTLR
jgi:hypothetical protein